MLKRAWELFQKHQFVLAILLVTCVVYFKTLVFPYISWDDPEMVFKNQDVISFNLKAFFTSHYVGNYIPLTLLMHATAWAVFGDATWGHHLLNILLHLINGLLVFNLSTQLFKNKAVAGTASLVFLLHPLQVESVVWISELKNILSTAFFLGALSIYVSYVTKRTLKLYFASFLLFLLACLSKSSAVVLPLILIVMEWFLEGKFSLKLLYNKLPFFALSLLFGIINLKTQAADQFINHSHEFPYYQRLALSGFALMRYLWLFIAPVHLSVVYPYPTITTPVLVTGFLAVAAILAVLWVFIRKKATAALLLLFFALINLVLVLQFIPFGEVLYADRYSYIPLIAFGWGLGLLAERFRLPALVSGLVVVALLALLTFSRTTKWKTSLTLYEDILKNYPGQFLALNSAGVECMFLNQDTKAQRYFDEAVKVAPNNYKGFYNRGLLLLKNNQPERAISSFNQALALYDYHKAYVGRATAYLMAGDLPKAINDAGYVLQKDPKNEKANYVLGNCYNNMNALAEALTYYNKCIELNNKEAEYYFKRAIVRGKQQEFNESKNDLDICLLKNPDFVEAYYWRGVAKANLKQDPCADFTIAAQKNFEPAVKAYYKYCGR